MGWTLRAVAAVTAAGALLGAGSAEAAIRLTPRGTFIFTPGTRAKVWAVVPGRIYRFSVDYEVGGARRIATEHVFGITRTTTRERLAVFARSFRAAPPGVFNEAQTFQVPSSWQPGVYRFSWALTARAPGQPPVTTRGARSFLVVPKPAR
ncbi:MAG TPA: hypothetical protein VKD47_03320 [Miltoncostaeaceae bacterium]|nr:hypothetical protein [Miltoncostaeaceae bacterium]